MSAYSVKTECPECDGNGRTTYLHSDSREWGPDFRDCRCDHCDGTGEVDHKCPSCGEAHDNEICPQCEGCESCCGCVRCDWCSEPIPEGGEVIDSYGEPWCSSSGCRREFESRFGPYCRAKGKPCVDCGGCEDRACALWAENHGPERG